MTMYRGYCIVRFDNFHFDVPSLTNVGFTRMEYAKEYIDQYIADHTQF